MGTNVYVSGRSIGTIVKSFETIKFSIHPAVTLIQRGSINHKQNQNHLSDGIAREKERKEYSSLLIKFEFSRGENNTKSRQSYVSLSNE